MLKFHKGLPDIIVQDGQPVWLLDPLIFAALSCQRVRQAPQVVWGHDHAHVAIARIMGKEKHFLYRTVPDRNAPY